MENKKLSMDELGRLSPDEFKNEEKIPVVIILDNIRSHHNVGSVFRTADAFPIEEIILCGYTPVPPHREIHKTALGATETVLWNHSTSTSEAVIQLKKRGYHVFAVEQATHSIPLNEFRFRDFEKTALVFGNEVGGVDQDVINLCDGVLEIPQFGTKHSINISVCAGILMWEAVRQLKVSQ